MSAFMIGQTVRSLVHAQRLVKDELYLIINVKTTSMPFGDYVTYTLKCDDGSGPELEIQNGRVILTDVPEVDGGCQCVNCGGDLRVTSIPTPNGACCSEGCAERSVMAFHDDVPAAFRNDSEFWGSEVNCPASSDEILREWRKLSDEEQRLWHGADAETRQDEVDYAERFGL